MNERTRMVLLNIIIVLVCVGLGFGIGVVVSNNNKNENNNSGINVDYNDEIKPVINPKPSNALEELDKNYEKEYSYEIVDNYFVAYKYDKNSQRYRYLNSFLCGDGCEIASYSHFTYNNLDKGLVVATSSDYRNYLFDFNKGLLGTYDYIESLELNQEYKYFVVKNGDYTSLLTLDGKQIYKFRGELNDVSLSGDEGLDGFMYSIIADLIVYKENDKYGLLKLSTGEKIIPAEFDYLRLIYYGNNRFNTDYVKVKENDKWYVYSIKNKEKSFNTGFDQIITIYNNVLVAENNKNISFKDLEGKNVISETIKINKSFEDIDWDFSFIVKSISFKVEANDIYILVFNNIDSLDYGIYYSIEDGIIFTDNSERYDNFDEYIKSGKKDITIYKFNITNKTLSKLN